MKYSKRTTLCLLGLASVLIATAGVGFSRPVSAEENGPTVQRTLLAPDTYEEYLPLTAPSNVAVSEDYKAFADGNVVYLYDEDNGVYRMYEHNVFVSDKTKNNVTQLQFDKFQNLYFLDASTTLYHIEKADLSNFASATAIDTGFFCSTFVIEDEMLYYTNVSTTTQISKVALESLDKYSAVLLQDGVISNPTLAFWDGELYYTDSGKYVLKINPESGAETKPTPIAMFPEGLTSMTINSGTFLCTDVNGDFFAYDLSALTSTKDPNEIPTLCVAENGYSALATFGEYVYTVYKNTVTRYNVANQAFDNAYSVCSASGAFNRLNDATETVFVDGILYTADNGNGRISIYNTETNRYQTPVITTIAPTVLASDNKTLLTASATQLILYSLDENSYGKELLTYNNLNDVTGVTYVYGKYYCATKHNRFFTVEQILSEDTGEQVWAIRNDTQKTYTRSTETLVSDAYGYLYGLYGTSVYRYTEIDFLSHSNQTGEKILDNLPANTKRIAVDYKRNVYAMTETKIYVYNRVAEQYAPGTEIPLKTGDVFTKTGHVPTLTAFTFGIEDNLAYLLYDGNYLIRTDELSLPTVKNIPVNGVDEQIFSEETAEFTLLKTNAHALLVEFDLDKMKGAQNFPYLSYKRADAEYTVLKLGSTNDYHLVALFNAETQRYNTYLILQSSCTVMDADEYQTTYTQDQQKQAWLTNNVALYKFPYLNPLLTARDLPRGGEITLLGEIGELDHEYYQISYTENGATKTGFIPKSYVLFFNPSADTLEEGEIGKTDSNVDDVWRLVYIALGLTAICILTDFLILRKREDD